MTIGKLFLVPTPIGNLKDITLRALEVLKSVDIIAAEDTRQSLKLLNHFEIKKSLISYHQHNEQGKSEEIIDRLKRGEIPFEVLPGATAITTALVYSGLDTTKFIFRGFIPRETKERKMLLEEIKDVKESIIIYESPHRLLSTLELIYNNLGNRKIAVCRELTKLHEEIVRGSIDEVIKTFEERTIKGEFVLVIEGKQQEMIEEENRKKWENLTIREHILYYIENGSSKKDAIKLVAKDRNVPKGEIYKYSTDI
ncbi:16S rRNA (cytidine(1402)-2'-O)-methyltransferase [Clostridium sp.]|uniref:16S rRNA (cytidine(1402)-2'-O)-methyltransferase n=1 Tax=Clostridium sp. TaxID=1506 RepID=UPI0029108918|nr:16S rRNA (cytidine(1402)-2'-O)-methyltransferase [Clostridium sp.]MDU3412649.1 16S rRNA (cytidine(1402)-2'-O)-methyltransferase [Clostridium sp.]